MPKIEQLRKKHPRFVYKKHFWKLSKKGLEISFDFWMAPDIDFRPTVVIEGVTEKEISEVGESALNEFIFNLGMAEIPSYWKASCPPEIIIAAGSLDAEQKKWWRWLLINGLGQFFYENKINPYSSGFLTIKNAGEKEKFKRAKIAVEPSDTILLPIGGGKDSAVTLEILAKKKNILCFCLNPSKEAAAVIKASGIGHCVVARRTIDKNLIRLNQRNYLNGHTPFSAYLAFLTNLTAALFGCGQVAVSNEASSNEATLKYLGKNINHQWSKTFSFEKSFNVYSKKYLPGGIEYLSFLRPLQEIQIAEIFSKLKRYHRFFLSCNEAHKTDSGRKTPSGKWCGECSKCLFAFMILYPFLPQEEIIKIFGQNLFENKKLLRTSQELTGERPAKPLECVGTRKESQIALYLSLEKFRKNFPEADPPYLLKNFEKNILPRKKTWRKDADKLISSWEKGNGLSKDLKNILKQSLESSKK